MAIFQARNGNDLEGSSSNGHKDSHFGGNFGS